MVGAEKGTPPLTAGDRTGHYGLGSVLRRETERRQKSHACGEQGSESNKPVFDDVHQHLRCGGCVDLPCEQ